MNSLLNLVGLKERYIKDDIVKSEDLKEIVYEPINKILAEERIHSFKYIDKIS